MNNLRDLVLLALWAMLGFATQLTATHWGLAGALAGGVLCGIVVWLAPKLLAISFDDLWPLPLTALAASLLGVACCRIVGQTNMGYLMWLAPLLAMLPTGIPAVVWLARGQRCGLCKRALRNVLAFSCPRCSMHICEYCWEFGRERCRLCEENHIALLPAESAWWIDRFGERRAAGDCSLCRTSAGATHTPQWGCGGCGHNQCVSCWDDCNGVCSRCGWVIPDVEDSNINQGRNHSPKDRSYA
ncbi:hypothetical protein [Silvibacterium acidisoli]|uniref:hypothetical protein n=1 Tax=Acidobacteriaceae bacterium ZG23-2 TaxID=2883246 RepID=UPI00406CD9EC